MSTNAFQGRVGTNIRTAKIPEIKYARDGFLFAHATEAGEVGLREEGVMTYKTNMVKDSAGRSIIDSYDYEITAKGLSTAFAALRNAYLLSKAPHQLRVKNGNGEYYNFVGNGGTFGTPTGSSLVGLSFKFRIDDKSRTLEYKWSCRVANTEHEWIYGNITAQTGNTGGSAYPLAAAASAARSQYRRSNISQITVNAVNVGIFKDPVIEIESTGQPDNRQAIVGDKIKVKVEWTMRQAAAADILGAASANDNDWTTSFTTFNDETITFATGAILIVSEFQGSDKEFYVKCVGEAEIPYNAVEATPNSIDIGVTTPTTLTISLT
jgi:hypothetical protein